MRTARLLSLALCLLVASSVAAQAPRPPAGRQPLPDLELEGTSGASHRLTDYVGHVLVLIYEDRHSTHQNAELKLAMRERAEQTDLGDKVTFVPIADLDGYGFFAVRPFARNAVRNLAEKFGIEILLDWSGEIARALGLAAEQSNVLILDRAGRVVFRSSGALGPEGRSEFFAALDRAVASAG